jgi:DNA-binding GntR family transcriptional regulator
MPSERELTAAFSVSRESVRSAIQDLASRGLVEVSQGARTRVLSTEGAARDFKIASPHAINSYDLHLRSCHGAHGQEVTQLRSLCRSIPIPRSAEMGKEAKRKREHEGRSIAACRGRP